MSLRDTHIDAIQAHARLILDLQADGYRGHLGQYFRFLLEEPIEVDRNPKHGSSLREEWSAPTLMSEAAREVWTNGHDFRQAQRSGLCGDHAVPLNVTVRQILQNVDDRNSIDRLVRFGLQFVFITRSEDKKLNAAGLRSKMPEGWTQTDGPFARYDAVGIRLVT